MDVVYNLTFIQVKSAQSAITATASPGRTTRGSSWPRPKSGKCSATSKSSSSSSQKSATSTSSPTRPSPSPSPRFQIKIFILTFVKKVFVFTFEIVKCGGQTFPEISITSQSIQVNNKHLQKLWPRKRRESWFRR